MHRLSAVGVKNLQDKGFYPDGGGLYLRITETGTKGWIFRFTLGTRTRDAGLGICSSISLASAREIAEDCRKLLRQGIDPIEHRKRVAETQNGAVSGITFREAVSRYIAAHETSWRNAKHREQWRNTLGTYVAPVIGNKDVAAITTEDVLQILEPIWQAKPETATRVRGRIANVLDWCRVRKYRDGPNPALWRGHLAHLLPAHKKKSIVRHHPALSWAEIPKFITELRTHTAISARALDFTILTASRTSEAILALWPEIDIDNQIWTVPPQRMKAGVEHRVPLSAAAVELLRDLPRFEESKYIFPGAKLGRPFSNMAMLEVLRGMRPGLTVHGFRSTFRDWAAEATSFPSEVVEMALAHTIESAVERAYRRGDLFQKRRALMETWAAYCGSGLATATAPQLEGV